MRFELFQRERQQKQNETFIEVSMREEYDFSKSVKNPYAKQLKKQITIRIENETIDYFKNLANETDIPYQKLINMYLANCAKENIKPSINWVK